MEWTPARIRLFRDVGLCLPQERFARTLGFAERTIGNAERGVHPPSLALRRALDQALENATRHATAAAYLAVAKLAMKLGDTVLVSVAADRVTMAANEIEHPALVGSAQILTFGAEKIASVVATPHLNCRQEEALSVRGSLLLLAIIAARRSDHNAAQDVLREASQLAEQLGCDGNWLWTAFGPTNVAIAAAARTLISILMGRECRGDTPGLRGRAARAGLLP
jgi:DNA-binding XRE family transcriptional regulator